MTQTFLILSFLLPFQLGYHMILFAPTVFGFLIDYLIPTLYLTDVVILFLVFFWLRGFGKKIKVKPKNIFLILGILTYIIFNISISDYFVPSFYKWIKVFEFGVLFFIIKFETKIKFINHFLLPLSFSIVIVSVLAIWQFFVKGSVGGIFYFLGERTFNFYDPGISPYPYSTFSHPNSMAGFFAVYLFLLIKNKNVLNKFLFWSCLFLTITVLLLTNSINVYLAIFVSAVFLFFKINKQLFLIFITLLTLLQVFVINPKTGVVAIDERVKLVNASVEFFKKNPVFGVGLNNFIPNLLSTNLHFENSWQLQPVHNIYLLVLSELGVAGLMFLIYFFPLLSTAYYLLPILFTGLFDHYWLTLQQNMLLFTILLGFLSAKIKLSKKSKDG